MPATLRPSTITSTLFISVFKVFVGVLLAPTIAPCAPTIAPGAPTTPELLLLVAVQHPLARAPYFQCDRELFI